MSARWLIAGSIWAVACARPPAREIVVNHTAPHLGDVLPRCEIEGSTFHLRVSATCVVDSNKRVVVRNFATGATLIDTAVTRQALPNFPVDGAVDIYLPCQVEQCQNLHDEKHELIVELTGDCGGEHAAGSEHCGTGP